MSELNFSFSSLLSLSHIAIIGAINFPKQHPFSYLTSSGVCNVCITLKKKEEDIIYYILYAQNFGFMNKCSSNLGSFWATL